MVIWEFLRSRQFAPFTINQNHVYHPLVVAGTEPILLLVTQHLESGQMLEWVKPAFFPSAQLFGGITVLLKKPVCLTDNSTTGSFPQPSVSSVAQSCPTLCDLIECSTPGFPVHHQLPEFTQSHVHQVGDAIQPSHPLSSPSPPTFNLSQHPGLFKWVSSLHQVANVLEFQLQQISKNNSGDIQEYKN